MNRPDRERIAKARAAITRFLATNPKHELAEPLRDLMLATAPPTKDQALHVMVKHANMAGDWASDVNDEQRAMDALGTDEPDGAWEQSIWAQWQTLVHFCGGMEQQPRDTTE